MGRRSAAVSDEPVTLEGIGRDIRHMQRDLAHMRDQVHGAILRRVEAALVTAAEGIRAWRASRLATPNEG
jgi:hypothetical protein